MASWGPKLYQDDVAEDVRNYYKDQLKRGKTNEEVTKELIEDNKDIILDEDEAPVFWFSLADTQWNLGRLEEKVKLKALYYLENGQNLGIWQNEDKKEFEIRKKVLLELKQKLRSKQPQEKKITRYKQYNCDWNVGDIFAYKIKNEKYKDNYMVFIKVGEEFSWPASISPVVYVLNKIFDEIPSVEKIKDIHFLPQLYAPNTYKNGLINILYKCNIAIDSKKEKILKQITFIGKTEKVIKPKNEKNDIYETNNMRYLIAKNFEEEQLLNYENWKDFQF